MINKILYTAIIILLLINLSFSAIVPDVEVSPVGTGIGSAYSGLSVDNNALQYNVGALAYIKHYEVNFSHLAWIFGTSFDSRNRGTFTITAAQGGLITEAFVEFENPNGVTEVVTQGTTDAILFFNPERRTLNNKTNFAAVYQTESRTIEIFMPNKVMRESFWSRQQRWGRIHSRCRRCWTRLQHWRLQQRRN